MCEENMVSFKSWAWSVSNPKPRSFSDYGNVFYFASGLTFRIILVTEKRVFLPFFLKYRIFYQMVASGLHQNKYHHEIQRS